jgi:phenylalanyl-tRNA synthetase beta chain
LKIPLAWLRDYTHLPETPKEIAEKLASLGFPVEGIEERPQISGVVVGRIAAIAPHPNADRLQVCTIDTGNELPLTIATAATNVAQGQVVPVATIGAVLPEMTITPRKMRGIDSEGMLCSAAELGLEADWFEDGIMQLDHDLPLGADVVAHFGLQAPVLDVEVTSNRADVLSIYGVARELAAAYGRPLIAPHIATKISDTPDDVPVHLESKDVFAFITQRITNVRVGPAPSAMRIRLALAGQRPINALVDISNYVMLELGQPMHFYDADSVSQATLIVRDAQAGERLTTLDGVERALDPSLLIIADPTGPLGIAGIRGGMASEISSATTSLILECASFRAARIRRGAAKLGFRTEASARYEKGLAPALIEHSAARAAHLLGEIGAVVYRPKFVGKIPPPVTVFLPRGAADRLIGIPFSDEEIRSALERLGFSLNPTKSGWDVTAPYWRSDITEAADLIEEVARMVGYDRIEASEATFPPTSISSETYLQERALASRAAQLGFNEVVTFSLESAQVYARFERAHCAPAVKPIEIRNPLSEEQRYLRFSILPGLLETVARRSAEIRERGLMLFEISHVFPEIDYAAERNEAMFIVAEPRRAKANTLDPQDAGYMAFAPRIQALLDPFSGHMLTLERAQAAGFHPGKTACLRDGDREIALLGALDPRLAAIYEIDADCYIARVKLADLAKQVPGTYRPASRYPAVTRDLALVMPQDVSAAGLRMVVTAADPLVKNVRVFDEYRGEQIGDDRKSLALRVVLQSDETTLTDTQADTAIETILAHARHELGAVLRT